jgi:hypothetical protein
MFLCLIEVDCTVSLIHDGVTQCMLHYNKSQEISPGSRGNSTYILLENLINANLNVTKYANCSIFHWAGYYLRGKLGIALLSLFFRKNSEGIKSVINGRLSIYIAAPNSPLVVIKFLLDVHPETLTTVTSDQGNGGGGNLLHQACENNYYIADARFIVEYLCKLCPTLVRMKCSEGNTPLHLAYRILGELNVEVVKILCDRVS